MARLALRELWISFRLFAVLAGFVAVAALVALLPAPLPVTLERLALGLGAATGLTAGVAALSMAEERRTGRAGWLVTRSLPRGTPLVGWFAAVAATGLLGLVAAAILGWLAASNVAVRLAAAGYISAVAGVGATLLAAVALGLLAGTVMRVVPAVLLVVVGVQFVTMGLLSELVMRTYYESTGRTIYAIRNLLRGREARNPLEAREPSLVSEA